MVNRLKKKVQNYNKVPSGGIWGSDTVQSDKMRVLS